MTPAITVLPTQDSMPICIYAIVSQTTYAKSCQGSKMFVSCFLTRMVGSHTAFTICCSCSDMPALGFMADGIAPGPPGNAMLEVGKG